MGKELSAKDKAFEKERARYRKKIRELEHEVNVEKIRSHQIREELQAENNKLEARIRELEEQIKVLCKIQNLDLDMLEAKIQADKELMKLNKWLEMNGFYIGIGV